MGTMAGGGGGGRGVKGWREEVKIKEGGMRNGGVKGKGSSGDEKKIKETGKWRREGDEGSR